MEQRAEVGHNGTMVPLAKLRQEKAAILRLAREHGARSIRVFGSVARGDNVEGSDVDFLVEFDAGRTLFDLIGLRLDLCELLGVEVDLATPGSLKHIREGVLAEAIAI